MNTPNYSAAMWLLYATCRLLISNCRRKLSDFAEFSAAYTDELLDTLSAQVDQAESLPSEEVRAQEHSQLLEELKPLYKTCQKKMQFLKKYIMLAFGKEFWEMNFASAGLNMYNTDMNWSEAQNMYVKALQYIANNSAALQANNNMPVAFLEGFTDAVGVYNAKLASFDTAKVTSAEGTDAKIEANNTAYEAVMNKICEVGQAIYNDNETLRGEFSFEKMSETLRPTGPAGLKGIVLMNGQPQAGLTVELEQGNKVVITNENGEFDFGNKLASGNDTIIVKQGDQILTEEDVVIPPGVTKHEDVEIPTPPAPVA